MFGGTKARNICDVILLRRWRMRVILALTLLLTWSGLASGCSAQWSLRQECWGCLSVCPYWYCTYWTRREVCGCVLVVGREAGANEKPPSPTPPWPCSRWASIIHTTTPGLLINTFPAGYSASAHTHTHTHTHTRSDKFQYISPTSTVLNKYLNGNC